MGAEQSTPDSSPLPWRNKSAAEIDTFWESFPRVVALVQSVMQNYARDIIYVPLLFKKLVVKKNIDVVAYPEIVILDDRAVWDFKGILPEDTPAILRVSLMHEKVIKEGGHAVSAILRWNASTTTGGKCAHVQWLDSSKISDQTDLDKLETLLKLNIRPGVHIEMDRTVDACPILQHFSQTCALWSLLLIAVSLCDNETTGEAVMRSKSVREFSSEFRAFVAWIHDDLLGGKLLQEHIFFPEECDRKLIDRHALNEIAVVLFSRNVEEGGGCQIVMLDTLSGWARSGTTPTEDLDWLLAAHARLCHATNRIENIPKLPLLMFPEEQFLQFIRLVGSDVWDPDFDYIDDDVKQAKQAKQACTKCGQRYCMSTNKSRCHDEKIPVPNEVKLWEYKYKEDEMDAWVAFIKEINPRFAEKVRRSIFETVV